MRWVGGSRGSYANVHAQCKAVGRIVATYLRRGIRIHLREMHFSRDRLRNSRASRACSAITYTNPFRVSRHIPPKYTGTVCTTSERTGPDRTDPLRIPGELPALRNPINYPAMRFSSWVSHMRVPRPRSRQEVHTPSAVKCAHPRAR